MDSTPSPSSSSPFELVSSALERYIPRGGPAAAAGPADTQSDRPTSPRVPDLVAMHLFRIVQEVLANLASTPRRAAGGSCCGSVPNS